MLDPVNRAGARVYADNDCASRHKIRGEGSASAPDLSFIGNTREVEWMKQYIRDPDSLRADATMPPHKRLRADELDQLVAYLKSLRQ